MGYQSKRKRRRRRRRRDEELVPTLTNTKNPVDEVQSALKNPALMKNPATVMAMQSVLGNQAVQRVLAENADAIQRDGNEPIQQDQSQKIEKPAIEQPDKATGPSEAQIQKMNERVEQYSVAVTKLEEVFPKQDLQPMLDMLGIIGFKPDEQGFLLDIFAGKHPEYLPVADESVYSLDSENSEATGRPYFFSDDVRQNMIRLEIIMSMFFPKDHIMQAVMDNPVVTVQGMDGTMLGVTGLGNSAQLTDQLNVKAHIHEFSPIARIITLDQARKLTELDPQLFRVLLKDILPEHELEDITTALENFLKQLKGMVARDELLREPEWHEAKLRGMLDKDSSSFDQVLVMLNALPK